MKPRAYLVSLFRAGDDAPYWRVAVSAFDNQEALLSALRDPSLRSARDISRIEIKEAAP